MGGGGGNVQISQGERQLADLSLEQWNDYKVNYQPLDQQMIARSGDKNRNRTNGINMATGGAGQAFDAAEKGVMKSLSVGGVNPNSGRGVSVIADMKRGRGVSVGKAGVSSEIETDKRYAGTMFNTAAHGRGVKGVALNGINATAVRSHNNAVSDAKFKSDENVAMINGISKAAGAAAGIGMAVTGGGPNGAASGWEAFNGSRDAGGSVMDSFGVMRGQMQANRN